MIVAEATLVVAHRRNTREALRDTDPRFGVEVDIRTSGERLIVHHDPFVEGEDFVAWLDEYRHALLILNVKEEGLETRLLGLLAERGIGEFFFLDQSFPFLVRTVMAGERRCAVRISEYESVETAATLAGRAEWIWLDCFTGALPDVTHLRRLADLGFRICAVSPELQGRDPVAEIPVLRAHLVRNGITLDAVCTKVPEQWI